MTPNLLRYFDMGVSCEFSGEFNLHPVIQIICMNAIYSNHFNLLFELEKVQH